MTKSARRRPAAVRAWQNQRFLRHRYVDPMTGKDEWRQIHIANGVLTDSKLTKPTGPGGKEDPKTPNGFVGELAGLGGSQNSTQGGGASSVRDRRRTSDGANATMPGPALPGGDLSGGQNSGVPPLPGQGPGNGQSALPGTQTYPTGQPGFSGQPGMAIPGQPGFPGTVSGVTAIQPGANPSSGNSFGGGSSSFVGGGNSFVGGGSATPTYPGQTLPGQQIGRA